jgi:hypothetical protein
MTEAWEVQLREDLERAGERAVRDDISNRGGLTTGGAERQKVIREWLRDKDIERETKEQALFELTQKTFGYTRKTYYAAVAALVAAVVGIIVTILHL